MITLVASTVTTIISQENRDRVIRLFSDSTTLARISQNPDNLEVSTGGHILTAYQSLLIELPAGQDLLAVSAGTPNLSWCEVSQNGAMRM